MLETAPRAVFFDVNETLYALDPVRDRMGEVGVAPEMITLWFARILRDGIAAAAAEGFAAFRDMAAYHLTLLLDDEQDPDEAVAHVLGAFETVVPHPDIEPALQILTDAGLELATLTNGTVKITRGLLERAGLADKFTRMMEVSEVRSWKPRPEPYRVLARELGIEPAEAVMVAVHPWDIHGAIGAGLAGAYLDRNGEPYPDFFTAPNVTGTSMVEVAEAIASAASTG